MLICDIFQIDQSQAIEINPQSYKLEIIHHAILVDYSSSLSCCKFSKSRYLKYQVVANIINQLICRKTLIYV